jgi:L-ascorbate metabolism protein UlaG (beta-lactamase superfamily)
VSLKIELLNHASVLLEHDDVRLLMDPWFAGTCFDEGWGLRFDNAHAMERAESATHLWISHFHADHFHAPTLRALAERNPDVRCLGNASFNFRLDEALRRFGFRNVEPFGERTPVPIGAGVVLERYPTTGIDNILVIRTPHGTVVNYNDCNIPLAARRTLARRIGPVEIFLTNFNHANKLLCAPLPPAEEIKAEQARSFVETFAPFEPRHVIPFASFHYYRAPESREQNESLLDVHEVCRADRRVVPLQVGETAEFSGRPGRRPRVIPSPRPITLSAPTVVERRTSRPLEQLQVAAAEYCAGIRRSFQGIWRLLPPVTMEIADLRTRVQLTAAHGLVPAPTAEVQTVVHSAALFNWWTKPYGLSSFIVGAHLGVVGNPRPMQLWTLAGLLVENKLDVPSLWRMLRHPEGRQFLWNRREEILGLVGGGRLLAGAQR